MGVQNVNVPKLPAPWTDMRTGQPTPAFYRFILSLTDQAAGSRVIVQTIATPAHTLSPFDLYTYMVFTQGCTVTVPTDINAKWAVAPIEPVFAFEQQHASGKVVIQGEPGVQIDTLAIYKKQSFGQYAVMQMIEKAPNRWTLFGAQDPA